MRTNATEPSLVFGKGRNATYVTHLSIQLTWFLNLQKHLSCEILDIMYLQKVAFPEFVTSYFPRPRPIYCIKYSLYNLQEIENGKVILGMLTKYPPEHLSKKSLSSAALQNSIFPLCPFLLLSKLMLLLYVILPGHF